MPKNPIPAPSPELYRKAAELSGTCGWVTADLHGQCDPEEGRQRPCCVNGHLMLAIGRTPEYGLYSNSAYDLIVREVLETIKSTESLHPEAVSTKRSFDSASWLEGWNDVLPFAVIGKVEADGSLKTVADEEFYERDDDTLTVRVKPEIMLEAAETERRALLLTAERLESEAAQELEQSS